MQSWIDFLTSQNATFSAGRVTGFGEGPAANLLQAAGTHGSYLCDLSQYGLISISGPEAASFLHAQLTNDVVNLPEGHAQWNSWCSPKGRMLASFLLWRVGDAYSIMLPRAIQAAIQKRLGMFVLRAKVSISDQSDAFVRIGLVSLASATSRKLGVIEPLPDAGFRIATSATCDLFLVPIEVAPKHWHALAKQAAPSGADVWDLGLIRDGIAEVRAETQDRFVPQAANYELIGGVSFKKGCYPGQEIVARTQYRGILKRRMVRATVPAGYSLRAGDAVYSPLFPEQAVGDVVSSALSGDQQEILLVAQLEAIRGNSLYADATYADHSKLTQLPLPYALPSDAS
jgi:tRNA-modifying protein YgfZ